MTGYAETLARLKADVDRDPEAFLRQTQDLRAADLLLIGQVIQFYCFADLNARRIIDGLRGAAIGPDAMTASRLVDADVFPHLRTSADLLWPSAMREGLHKAADSIDINRSHRHLFAHWSARRVADQEVLILFSKNATEARRRDGVPQAPSELKFAMVPLAAFREELPVLAGHSEYLAECASDIERQFEDFRREFAARRAAG